MSHKSRARRPTDQVEGDALRGQSHASTGPSDVEALAALRTLRAWMGAASIPAVFTQHDLPPDVTSAAAYLRRHRALRAAGVPGVWMRGKVAATTAEAWSTELPRARRLVVVEPARDIDAELDQALGIRTRVPR